MTRTYTYDAVGNRLTEVSDAGTTTYAHDAADRLATITPPGGGPIAYAFDNNGNQTAAGGLTFTYDYADRLKTATVGGTTETYAYVGDGVRLSASSGAQPNQTTKFLWDRAFGLPQLVIERDGSNALLRSYRYGVDLIDQSAGSSTYFYHHDGLGSVTDMTDVTGSSLIWSEYYPFGVVRLAGVGGQAPTNPFSFTGEQLDGLTGLYHLRARQYDPGTGRFLSTDPAAPPMTAGYVATYAYVRNQPTVGTDPSGACWPLCFAAVGAVVGGAVGFGVYWATHVDDFNGQEALGAFVGGAIAGAATGVAGPLGGSVAGALGFTGTSAVAVATATSFGIGAAGGVAGAEAASRIGTGQGASPEMLLASGVFNGLGGYWASQIYRTVGIFSASQAALFGPHTWGSLMRGILSGRGNAWAIWRQAWASGLIGSVPGLFPTK